MVPFGEPMGTAATLNVYKEEEKKHLEARPLKCDAKEVNTDPQNLQNLNMAAEGYQTPLSPGTTKKSPKSHQNEHKRESMGAHGAQNTLPERTIIRQAFPAAKRGPQDPRHQDCNQASGYTYIYIYINSMRASTKSAG